MSQILKGEYTTAEIFADIIDSATYDQIRLLCNQSHFSGCSVKIMPDTHAGAGCVIGLTVDLKDIVIPNLIGVDIGCGVLVYNLGNIDIDYKELDDFIRAKIPAGFETRSKSVNVDIPGVKDVCDKITLSYDHVMASIGTLGGGNHFIEVSQDPAGCKYLVIHSGSRNFGLRIAHYHQAKAFGIQNKLLKSLKGDRLKKIADATKKYKDADVEVRKKAFVKIDDEHNETLAMCKVPKDLTFLIGEDAEEYLSDMRVAQQYAQINRQTMAEDICKFLNVKPIEIFESVHNYIDFEDNITRKGAISARSNEKVIIPINMRDGSIIGIGKGNENWNQSAPHGAGRIMGRREAKRNLKLADFEAEMEGIFTTSVTVNTLDEAPGAYKPMESILTHIEDTIDIETIIKTVYNFKAI